MTRPRKKLTSKRRTPARRSRTPLAAAPDPTITLDGPRIAVAGCDWAPSPKTMAKLTAAGATRIGMATTATPGVIQFPSAEAARAVFESAFNAEDDEWGLDEPTEGGLPDATRWLDPVGMDAFACELESG